jgi:hypothetical protein
MTGVEETNLGVLPAISLEALHEEGAWMIPAPWRAGPPPKSRGRSPAMRGADCSTRMRDSTPRYAETIAQGGDFPGRA